MPCGMGPCLSCWLLLTFASLWAGLLTFQNLPKAFLIHMLLALELLPLLLSCHLLFDLPITAMSHLKKVYLTSQVLVHPLSFSLVEPPNFPLEYLITIGFK